jgi:hypothetical protein
MKNPSAIIEFFHAYRWTDWVKIIKDFLQFYLQKIQKAINKFNFEFRTNCGWQGNMSKQLPAQLSASRGLIGICLILDLGSQIGYISVS